MGRSGYGKRNILWGWPYCNFDPCGIFKKMSHHLLKILKLGASKINCGRKFSGIILEKLRVLMFVVD